jgi:hypothetical protein
MKVGVQWNALILPRLILLCPGGSGRKVQAVEDLKTAEP